MISDEVLEAAAAANYEARTGKKWSVASTVWKALERSWMLRSLEAAAPHMLADAWDEGEQSGAMNHAAEEYPEAKDITNPYRSQA